LPAGNSAPCPPSPPLPGISPLPRFWVSRSLNFLSAVCRRATSAPPLHDGAAVSFSPFSGAGRAFFFSKTRFEDLFPFFSGGQPYAFLLDKDTRTSFPFPRQIEGTHFFLFSRLELFHRLLSPLSRVFSTDPRNLSSLLFFFYYISAPLFFSSHSLEELV